MLNSSSYYSLKRVDQVKTPWVIVSLMGWADIKPDVPGSLGVQRDCTMFWRILDTISLHFCKEQMLKKRLVLFLLGFSFS